METTYINKKATYYHYEITIVINETVVDYDVHIAVTNDKKWIQNYGKKHIVKLTTSERKQIKKYIENDFIGVLANDKTSESGLDLHFVSVPKGMFCAIGKFEGEDCLLKTNGKCDGCPNLIA